MNCGAKIRQTFKTSKLFTVFFHSTLRFSQKNQEKHNFCDEKYTFRIKVIIFASSYRYGRHHESYLQQITDPKYQTTFKTIKL